MSDTTEMAVTNQGEQTTETVASHEVANQANTTKASDFVPELESLGKFKLHGKEWTFEELNKSMLMQADYTRKTQEIAQDRKYMENLRADLENVRVNPALTERFKQIYPEKFHNYLDLVMQAQSAVEEASESGELTSNEAAKLRAQIERDLEKKLADKFDKLERVSQTVQEREMEAADKHLQVVLDKLSDKYPYAIQDAVLNRAEKLVLENQNNPHFRMTEALWDRLFKATNSELKSKLESRYKSEIEALSQKSQKASDVPPGGSAPGRAQKKMSFKEAEKAMIEDLRSKGFA